jgi:uncharacterized membrane protein YbhN (UPF0104 family)
VAGQVVLAFAVVYFAADRLRGQWNEVLGTARGLEPRWLLIVASGITVLLTYGVLIETWRTVVRGWGAHLSFGDAARIWTISNLGRYVPGKVWALGSMAMMAQRKGVSGIVAAGSSLVVMIINLAAGLVVAAITGAQVLGFSPLVVAIIVLIAAGILLAPAVLPRALAFIGRISGKLASVNQLPVLPPRSVYFAAGASALAWIMYGMAFQMLTVGVLGSAPGATTLYIAVFTGSYVLGFLVLIAPAGLGVREASMAAALARAGFAVAPATVLVVTSRLWLTVLELGPALLFLAYDAVRATRSHVANKTPSS